MLGQLSSPQDRMVLLRDGIARLGDGGLTKREREVSHLILCGYSNDAIGCLLEISSGTVKIHRKNLAYPVDSHTH